MLVRDLSFSVPTGQSTIIMGPNGRYWLIKSGFRIIIINIIVITLIIIVAFRFLSQYVFKFPWLTVICLLLYSGKSSLFRVLAELWPLQSGVISRPPRGEIFYLSQVIIFWLFTMVEVSLALKSRALLFSITGELVISGRDVCAKGLS